ncbi:MAG: hypothetical protein RMJ43_09520 [Chloroherpetonaceae bacterium]|nr:hypothetical protein [Chthonomonadaceae bacterium]MDW8208063.1 hypothetical protein [Chloroherpetonaceae bacterium]
MIRSHWFGAALLLATAPCAGLAQQVEGFQAPTGYAAFRLGLSGSAFAVAPDGKFALAQDDFGGRATVTVYDRIGTGRRVLTTFQAPAGTSWQFLGGLAWQDASTLVISENGSARTVFSASLTSGEVTLLAPVNSLPNVAQIAFAPDGVLYAGLANGPGANAVVTVAGGTVRPFASNFGAGYLGGLAFRPADGALFVGDTNDPFFAGNPGQVLQLSPDGLLVGQFSLAGGGGSGIYDLVFAPNGDLFASTGRTLTLLRAGTSTAVPFGMFSGVFPFPTELDFFGGEFAPFSGGSGQLIVNGEFTGVGGLFVVQPAAVPEPSGLILVAAGPVLLFLLFLRRRVWLAVVLCVVAPLPTAAQFATRVWAYNSAGAVPGFTDPTRALGPPSTTATPTVPDNSSIVSIGNGGYLVLGFDAPIRRQYYRRDGFDFIVFGNAFYVGGNIHLRFQEPGFVEVGLDLNRNGYDPDDPFYLLRGSPNPTSLPFQGIDDRIHMTWGYADVTPTNGAGNPFLPDDPFTSGITPGSAGGDAFSLSWAVDASGNPVVLDYADFIRIRPAGNWSTEIDAVVVLPWEDRRRPDPRSPYERLYQVSGPPRGFRATPAAVPEPASATSVAMGMALWAWRRRRSCRGNH